MKHRAILLIVVLFGIQGALQWAHAVPPPSPAPPAHRGIQNPNFLGPRSGGDLWNVPAATVNPGSFIPDDSAASHSRDQFAEPHFDPSFGRDSFQLANAFKGGDIDVESAKPIEKVEVHSEGPLDDQPAPIAAPPKRETKRIAIVALGSVALLAFRKFRRTNASPFPRKPSFL